MSDTTDNTQGIIFAVTDPEERTVTLGELQSEWLLNEGHIFEVPTGDPSVRLFRTEKPAGYINHLVFSRLELRECDFCRVTGAPWEIPCRPFKLTTGPAPGMLGGPERPVVACSVCVELARNNRKQELVERVITETIAHAMRKGGRLREIAEATPTMVLRRNIMPIAKDVVYGMFANRDGHPRRTEVT